VFIYFISVVSDFCELVVEVTVWHLLVLWYYWTEPVTCCC